VIGRLLAEHWDTLPALQAIIDHDRHLRTLYSSTSTICWARSRPSPSANPPPKTALTMRGGYVREY